MSSLFSNSSSANRSASFADFARSTNPQKAQQQVQGMLSSGQITQKQLDNAIGQAQMLCNLLGLK